MKIQPYEEIKRFDSIGLVVTNRRIRYEVQNRICQSMSLTSVSSIGLAYKDEPKWIGYAILSGIAAYVVESGEFRLPEKLSVVSMAFCLYAVIRYILSRKNTLAIYGKGNDKIIIRIDRRSYKTALEVLDYVEDLKLRLE